MSIHFDKEKADVFIDEYSQIYVEQLEEFTATKCKNLLEHEKILDEWTELGLLQEWLDQKGYILMEPFKPEFKPIFELTEAQIKQSGGLSFAISGKVHIVVISSKGTFFSLSRPLVLHDRPIKYRTPAGIIFSVPSTLIGRSFVAMAKQFIISNGNTAEYSRVDFENFSTEGQIIDALMKVSLDGSVRSFDFKRKCWFVESEALKLFVNALESLRKKGVLAGYNIIDQRTKVESFEEFFNATNGTAGEVQGHKTKTLQSLLSELEAILRNQCNMAVYIKPESKDIMMSDLKPLYRKAALALHPDRNNGDGSRMATLNQVWQELQVYLK